MEKKTSVATYVVQVTTIMLFFAILCFPMIMMVIDGPDDTPLESEAEVEIKPLTTDTYLDRSFHSSFEAWFSSHYPMRSTVVTAYKEMIYNVRNSDTAVAVFNFLESLGNISFKDPNPGASPTPGGTITLPDGTVITPGTNTPGTPGTDTPGTDTPGTDTPGTEVVDPLAIYTNPDNIYATINLRQLADTPIEPSGFKGSNSVYIGKSGYLFERAYIDEYYGFTHPYNAVTEEGVATTVEKLEYIQQELADRYEITMLYVLSSSKASQYAAYIPDHYKNRYPVNEGYVRAVDMMRPLLAASSINYLDSSAYYAQIGLLNTFPKTGIHWNHVASFESTSKLIRMYAEITGKPVKIPYATGVIEQTAPFPGGNSDVDVYNILYGQLGDISGKIQDEFYYGPEVDIENPDAPKINVFIQGGSFTSDIAHYIRTYQVGDVRRIYYNGVNTSENWGSDDPWQKGPDVWADILMNYGYDLIIFEQTEQQVRSEHASGSNWAADATNGAIGSNAVYDSLYQFLKETE